MPTISKRRETQQYMPKVKHTKVTNQDATTMGEQISLRQCWTWLRALSFSQHDMQYYMDRTRVEHVVVALGIKTRLAMTRGSSSECGKLLWLGRSAY